MNPFVMRVGDRYHLYYSGGDDEGVQRIGRATARIDTIDEWHREGVLLDVGAPGSFDARWCVLPLVHLINGRWHLYYTGNDGTNNGLQSFPGIGLAVSDDGTHFERYSTEPVITGDRTDRFPDNRGVAGGGTILEEHTRDGSIRYRMYYTIANGTSNADVRIDQEKHCAVCHSNDGITWTDHRVVLSPRADVGNEDIAVAAPFVWRDEDGLYRMIYCGIGTRWGFYSMSQAVSDDGYAWTTGPGDTNLTLAPDPESPWESEMVEYPCVLLENGRQRLFYCGNGYGTTGIGTALSRSRQRLA